MNRLSKYAKALLTTAVLLSSGNANVFANEMKISEAVAVERVEEGLYFDQKMNNYIQFASPFEKMPDTLLMRFKIDPDAAGRRILFGNYVWQKNCYALEITAENKLRYVEFVYENGAMKTSVDVSVESTEILNGEWVDFALVRDTAQDRLQFIADGSIIETIQLSGTGTAQLFDDVPLDTVHYVGNDSRNQYNLTGSVSDVQLWERCLDAEETIDYLHERKNISDPDLMHAYILDQDNIDPDLNIIVDEKVNGINGIAYGFSLPDAPVYEKQGTDFSANDKDLEMTKVLDEIPMTVETWVRAGSDQRGFRSIITGNYFDAYMEEIPLFNFELTANGEPRIFWYVDGVMTEYIAQGITVYNDRWTHVAITCEKIAENKVQFITYINGKRVHSGQREFSPVLLNQPMKIGEDSRFAHYFKGSMADLRLWSTTRSAEEIAEHFDGTVAADANGLLGNWLLDEADADGTYADRSINGNDAVSYWIDDDLFAKAAEGYESIAIIPDTQSLSYWVPESFTTMTTWLRDHADELGIKLAIHVGDIVNERDYASEWNAAKASMQVLDGTIPYVFSPGNHDTQIQQANGVWHGVRNTSGMNNAFPYAQYAKAETFGGAFEEGKMDNTYSYFTVAGQQIMTISLEQNPRDEVLEWANAIAAANPDRKIIVTTHEYLFYDGKPTTEQSQDHLPFIGGSNTGQQLWEKFGSKHENIVAIVSGHVGYPDVLMREAIGDHGNVVQQILCDAQFMDRDDVNNGSGKGLGMVMILSFKEGSNEVKVNWYSTVREQFFRASDQYTAPIQMYDLEADKEHLHELIELAQKMDEKEYTVHSWNVLVSAWENAKVIMADDEATQDEVDNAAQTLSAAIDALQTRASEAAMTALQDIVSKAEAMQEDSLNEAIENAKALLVDPQNASVTAVVSALLDLSEAMQAVNTGESVDALRADVQATIDFIKENILNNIDNVRPGKVDALEAAVDAAQTLVDDPETTADELKAANKAQTKAAQELWQIVSKAELNALIEAAQAYEEAGYTAESYAALQDEIANAKAVAENDDATTAEVTNAITNLANAIASLESITLDTNALVHEIELVTEMVANIDSYVPSTVEGLADKLADARNVLETATTQGAIDAATETLREARLNARTKADVSALEELIAMVNSLDLQAYTSTSVAALNVPYTKALMMISDEEVTQEAVDALAEQLQTAVDDLVKIDTNSTTAEMPAKDQTNTAAANMSSVMFGTMIAAGAALLMMRRRRQSK